MSASVPCTDTWCGLLEHCDAGVHLALVMRTEVMCALGAAARATPLLAALLCLEASDIVFAIDSVPAIFALTREPFVVFSSNVFAILGLRSLYFMLGGAVERFHLLRYGLAAVLVFVGLKMVWLDEWFGGRFPIGVSLVVIGSMLAISVWLSLMFPKRHPAQS